MPVIEGLMNSLTELQTEYPNAQTFTTPLNKENPVTEFMNSAINCAYTKLKKYYDLVDDSPYWIAGVVLHPFIKWKYFEQTWEKEPQWLHEGKKQVQKLWIQHKLRVENAVSTQQNSPAPASSKRRENRLNDDLFSWRHNAPTVASDEYEIYCLEPPLEYVLDPNLINEWRRLEVRFPILAKLALDILSIPAMSAECERVFSSAKHLLSDSRNSLIPETIEALECQRNWILHEYGPK